MWTGLAGITKNDKNKLILGLSGGKGSLKGGVSFPVTLEAPQSLEGEDEWPFKLPVPTPRSLPAPTPPLWGEDAQGLGCWYF